MPVLDISDGKGRLKARAREALMAVMAYPSDDPEEVEQRTELQCLWLYYDCLAREGEEKSDPVCLEVRDLRRLLFLNPREVHHNYEQQRGKGSVAGRILSNIELIARTAPGKASVNRAVDRVRYVASQKKEQGEMFLAALQDFEIDIELDGKPPWEGQSRTPSMSTSEAKIREYWGNFKSVSPFWAARMYSGTRFLFGATKDESYEFLDLLADAEHLRKFGEGHFARGQKKHNNSTLDPDATWKIPDDLALPESRYAKRPPVWIDSITEVDHIKGIIACKYSK